MLENRCFLYTTFESVRDALRTVKAATGWYGSAGNASRTEAGGRSSPLFGRAQGCSSQHPERSHPDKYASLQEAKDSSEIENIVTTHDALYKANLFTEAVTRMRQQLPKLYRQELLNNLFNHPYTRIEFVMDDLGVSRITATKYLEQLTAAGFLHKEKIGRTNYFINQPLCTLLIEQA